MIQVLPLNDIVDHEWYGTMCLCEPRVEWEHATALVIHRALDGRPSDQPVPGKKWEVFDEDTPEIEIRQTRRR